MHLELQLLRENKQQLLKQRSKLISLVYYFWMTNLRCPHRRPNMEKVSEKWLT